MVKKIAYLGLFTAVAAIMGYLEHLLPPIGIPGVKPGLANLSILLLLKRTSWKEAASVSLARIIIVSSMWTSLSAMIYSIAGAFISMLVMALLLKFTDLALPTVSVAGGVAHNVGQLLIAIPVLHSAGPSLTFAPFLIVAGVVTGLLVGSVTAELDRRLPRLPW